jgi:hypothetical protein
MAALQQNGNASFPKWRLAFFKYKLAVLQTLRKFGYDK